MQVNLIFRPMVPMVPVPIRLLLTWSYSSFLLYSCSLSKSCFLSSSFPSPHYHSYSSCPFRRFRPLNDTEERTGSKVIVKFPSGSDDQCVSIGGKVYMFDKVGDTDPERKV